MIPEFVAAWDARKHILRAKFAKKLPKDYKSIVKSVVSILGGDNSCLCPDPKRVVEIDHGEYQGTLVFVIASGGYEPDKYWYVLVNYGSCSACDTLEGIKEDLGEGPPTSEQVDDCMTLALHIVQRLKRMDDPDQDDLDD